MKAPFFALLALFLAVPALNHSENVVAKPAAVVSSSVAVSASPNTVSSSASVVAVSVSPVVGIKLKGAEKAPAKGKKSSKNGKDLWICPMHDGGHSDHAGKCPICGMDLINPNAAKDKSDQ